MGGKCQSGRGQGEVELGNCKRYKQILTWLEVEHAVWGKDAGAGGKGLSSLFSQNDASKGALASKKKKVPIKRVEGNWTKSLFGVR